MEHEQLAKSHEIYDQLWHFTNFAPPTKAGPFLPTLKLWHHFRKSVFYNKLLLMQSREMVMEN